MKKFFIFVVFLLSIVLFSCMNLVEEEDLASYKEESYSKIEKYFEKIKSMNLEYSLMFIEYEVENSKEELVKASSKEDIKFIEEKTLNQMANLVLSPEEMIMLKEKFCLSHEYKECSTLKYFFGKIVIKKYISYYFTMTYKPYIHYYDYIGIPENKEIEYDYSRFIDVLEIDDDMNHILNNIFEYCDSYIHKFI